jgi:NAD(P)-dependent dehydrogenase (short-subunit alcohol dehydrogenase family)
VTRFTTPFGFHTTAAEVVAGIDLTGKKAIVTGGAGGIGAETARALAAAGASVTLAVRRTDAAKTVVAELRQSTGNEAIDVRSLDLSDLRSVKAFTDAWEGPVHILVNNAGIMAVPELEKTAQGSSFSSARTSSDTSRSPPDCTKCSLPRTVPGWFP